MHCAAVGNFNGHVVKLGIGRGCKSTAWKRSTAEDEPLMSDATRSIELTFGRLDVSMKPMSMGSSAGVEVERKYESIRAQVETLSNGLRAFEELF